MADASWMRRAACLGLNPNMFHPQSVADGAAAKEVCRGCPVREECLEYALAVPETRGVWGGMVENRRKKIRGARMRAAAGG